MADCPHCKKQPVPPCTLEEYVNRQLPRPKTTWAVPALMVAAMLILPFAVALALRRFLALPQWQLLALGLLIDIPLLRLLLISLVKCYQHYASDRLRRYCLCIPSCSEYAIAVLKKYLLVIAVYKIVYRLVVTCDGEFKVDRP